MAFPKFLTENRTRILKLSEAKTLALAALRTASPKLDEGLPLFYDQLVSILRQNTVNVSRKDEVSITHSSGAHGKEFFRLGYTLSQVVHAYGALCQAITEVARELKAEVSVSDFHNLNRCIDIAIAGAVTEFETDRNQQTKDREVEHLGSMVHELRNAVSRATVLAEMIIKGIVGINGSTSKVLMFSLLQMGQLIDQGLSEVKLRADSPAVKERFFLHDLIDQLVITAELEAAQRGMKLFLEVTSGIEVDVDRHLLYSAVGNLVQNALKYTKLHGHVTISVNTEGADAVIGVRDQCGGLSAEKMEQMFLPFVQHSRDRSWLGLGLTISRKAVGKMRRDA